MLAFYEIVVTQEVGEYFSEGLLPVDLRIYFNTVVVNNCVMNSIFLTCMFMNLLKISGSSCHGKTQNIS